jgi:hypothetical protein
MLSPPPVPGKRTPARRPRPRTPESSNVELSSLHRRRGYEGRMSNLEGHLPAAHCVCRRGRAEGTSELGVGHSTHSRSHPSWPPGRPPGGLSNSRSLPVLLVRRSLGEVGSRVEGRPRRLRGESPLTCISHRLSAASAERTVSASSCLVGLLTVSPWIRLRASPRQSRATPRRRRVASVASLAYTRPSPPLRYESR